MKRYIKSSYSDYQKYEGWPEDLIELHKSIDWKAINYNDVAVEDTEITRPCKIYGYPGGTQIRKVEMCLYLRANPIYSPYFAPTASSEAEILAEFEECVGPMYDGRVEIYNGCRIDIHDRYENYKVYEIASH